MLGDQRAAFQPTSPMAWKARRIPSLLSPSQPLLSYITLLSSPTHLSQLPPQPRLPGSRQFSRVCCLALLPPQVGQHLQGEGRGGRGGPLVNGNLREQPPHQTWHCCRVGRLACDSMALLRRLQPMLLRHECASATKRQCTRWPCAAGIGRQATCAAVPSPAPPLAAAPSWTARSPPAPGREEDAV